jgi:hypothetical protein
MRRFMGDPILTPIAASPRAVKEWTWAAGPSSRHLAGLLAINAAASTLRAAGFARVDRREPPPGRADVDKPFVEGSRDV